ncbi:MAG: hypothetical protein QM756_35965 [Polyangiaceae bacterium]
MLATAPLVSEALLGGRRPAAVLDPWLCLNRLGPALIQRLQRSVELWIVRELWHILDNSHFYSLKPDALTTAGDPRALLSEYQRAFVIDQFESENSDAPLSVASGGGASLDLTLRAWERIRLSTDLAGLKLYWLGDGLCESLLPDGSSPSLHARHNQVVEALDRKLLPGSPVACGQRDALALALALGGVPVLSVIDGDDSAPSLCGRLLEASGTSCRRAPEHDALVESQRALWRSLLVSEHCASLVWSGLRLALVHVEFPELAFWSAQDLGPDADSNGVGSAAPASAIENGSVYWCEL